MNCCILFVDNPRSLGRLLSSLRTRRSKPNRKTKMKYAIKRHDGAIFPERYKTMAEAQSELNYKLGNGGGYGLAWIIQILENQTKPNKNENDN